MNALKFIKLAQRQGMILDATLTVDVYGDVTLSSIAVGNLVSSKPKPTPRPNPDRYDVFLTAVSESGVIACIKAVRTLTGHGLKDAKDLVDRARGVSYDAHGYAQLNGFPEAVWLSSRDASTVEADRQALADMAPGSTFEFRPVVPLP